MTETSVASADGTTQTELPIDAFANVNTVAEHNSYVVAVTGSPQATTDNDWSFIFEVLNRAHRIRPLTLILTTGRTGAEVTAEQWAEYNDVRIAKYTVAEEVWRREGRQAGPKRYARMLTEQKPDVVIGFSKNSTVDSGSATLLEMAEKRHNLPTHLFNTDSRTKEF